MKRIEVVAAIIHDEQNRIFATQRGYGDWKDYWEFPGGKMEPGESPEDALKREIWEELETRIVIERFVRTIVRASAPQKNTTKGTTPTKTKGTAE